MLWVKAFGNKGKFLLRKIDRVKERSNIEDAGIFRKRREGQLKRKNEKSGEKWLNN